MPTTLAPRPGLRARVTLRWPGQLKAGAGMAWQFGKGIATAALDYASLDAPGPIAPGTNHSIAAYDADEDSYKRVPLGSAAGRDVGQGAGKVAAGDDTRLVGAVQSSAIGAPGGVASQSQMDATAAAAAAAQATATAAQNAVATGRIAKDTLPQLNAALAYPDGTQGEVLTGPDAGLYVKSGASGTGTWVFKSAATVSALAAFRDLLQAGQKTLDPAEYELSGVDTTALVLDGGFRMLEQLLAGVRREKLPVAFDAGVSAATIALQGATLGAQAFSYLDASEYELSGAWAFLWLDDSKRFLAGITADYTGLNVLGKWLVGGPASGGITSQVLGGQTLNYIDGAEYELAGYSGSWMILGDDYRLIAPQPVATVTPTAPTPSSLYAIHTATDGTGKTQVYRHARGSGLVAQLSPAGSNNTAPRMTPDGDVIYSSDRTSAAPSNLYWTPVGLADERPYFPLPTLICAGDSMTASGYGDILGSALGVTAYNFGISADTSRAVASRLRAIDTPVAVAGNQIPASGAVAVTLLGPGNPISKYANLNASITGTLAGVPGTLASSSGAYTFTRTTAGSAVACPSGTLFLTDLVPSNSGGVAVPNLYDMAFIIWMGRNNSTDKATILSNYASIIAKMRPYVRRFLVSPIFNDTGETAGSANYALLMDVNAALEAAYPDNYPRLGGLDARQYIVSQYDPAQSQDVIDHNNDCTPTSLRNPGDGLHLNTSGNTKLATGFYKPVLQARGWF